MTVKFDFPDEAREIKVGQVVDVRSETLRDIEGRGVVRTVRGLLPSESTIEVDTGSGENPVKVRPWRLRYVAESVETLEAAEFLPALEYAWGPETTRQVVTATTDVNRVFDGDSTWKVGSVVASHELCPAGFFAGHALEIKAELLGSGRWERFWPCWPEGKYRDHQEAFRAAVEWVKAQHVTETEKDRRTLVASGWTECLNPEGDPR
jgi:hypothetical protein